MRVAIFTDNDFEKVSGVTTALKAVLHWAPPDVPLRVYAASRSPVTKPDYLALASVPQIARTYLLTGRLHRR